MSEKLVITAKMKARALSKLKLYWYPNSQGQAGGHQTWYSLDKRSDRRMGNPDPGIDRLVAKFLKPNLGKFGVGVVYLNRPGENLPYRKYNRHGISVPVDQPISYDED